MKKKMRILKQCILATKLHVHIKINMHVILLYKAILILERICIKFNLLLGQIHIYIYFYGMLHVHACHKTRLCSILTTIKVVQIAHYLDSYRGEGEGQ